MKSFQVVALLLWGFIFVVAAFVLGQFLASKDILDVSEIITGKDEIGDKTETETDDILASDVVIDKVGQETVRVGYNVTKEYFEDYYKSYINYIMQNSDMYPASKKVEITETLATDYIFYAVSNNVDSEKYKILESEENINIRESEINSFVDKMFEKGIDQSYKKDGKYGYDNASKTYSMEKNSDYKEYNQEVKKIENVTSNKLVVTYSCSKENNENTIQLTAEYKGGRYIVTEAQVIK